MLHALDAIGRVDNLVFLDSSEIPDDLNDMRRSQCPLHFANSFPRAPNGLGQLQLSVGEGELVEDCL